MLFSKTPLFDASRLLRGDLENTDSQIRKEVDRMGKQISDFDEIRIRGVDLDKKARLVQLADDQGKSLNQFLLEFINRLAERHEIMETETKYSELVGMTAHVIEKNSQVLEQTYQMLQIITGGNTHEQ